MCSNTLSTQAPIAKAEEVKENKGIEDYKHYYSYVVTSNDQYKLVDLKELLKKWTFKGTATVEDNQTSTDKKNQTSTKQEQKDTKVEQPKKEATVTKPVTKPVEKPVTKPVEEKVPAKPVEEKETTNQVVTQPTETPKTPVVESQPVKEEPKNESLSDIDAIEAKVVELTNAERAKNGLSALQIDKPLMAAAREKSQDMKDNNYFSHTSPTWGSPFDRLKALGISYQAAGENIAKGQKTAEEVVTAWMNSEGHRANILDAKFTHIGVGYVKDGNIWTQQFIKK